MFLDILDSKFQDFNFTIWILDSNKQQKAKNSMFYLRPN